MSRLLGVCNDLVQSLSIFTVKLNHVHVSKRTFIGKDLKRFYKNVTITQAEDHFEVNLDKRKLKTPMGKIFRVPNEPLALAVAAEWNAQDKVIKKPSMHFTSLCNTAIDNPSGRDKDTVIDGILEYLSTDTICYLSSEEDELYSRQKKEWVPLMDWFSNRYGVEISSTVGFRANEVPSRTMEIFRQHLASYNDWTLVGYQQAVESIKSVIITSAVAERHLSVESAVQLARLEVEHQISRWGNVEWHHDMDRLELQARLASSIIFFHLNSQDRRTSFKKGAHV